MHPAVPHRLLDRLGLGIAVLALAVPVTLVELGHPSLQMVAERLQSAAGKSASPAPAAAKPVPKKAAPKVATPEVAPPAPTPAPAAATNTATTNSFVHLRAAKSTSSAIILNLNAGTTVQLRDDADATWQGVTYQGQDGYIYRSYLQYQPTAQ